MFIDILKDAHEHFGCIIHYYCSMSNHYHMLFETPHASLSRIMRKFNGVYNQAHNRLKKTDGSLFRGRYKAILVDKDAYIMLIYTETQLT
ncbi:MAG: transposase [Marinicellaceae bacterium]